MCALTAKALINVPAKGTEFLRTTARSVDRQLEEEVPQGFVLTTMVAVNR